MSSLLKPVVLLARPHPFVATAMRDLLVSLGCLPVGPDEKLNGRAPLGVVISLALQSTVLESAVEVFVRVREEHPRAPVVFVSLASSAQILATLERSLDAVPSPPAIRALHETDAGAAGTALYLTKDDIEANPARVQTVLRSLFRR